MANIDSPICRPRYNLDGSTYVGTGVPMFIGSGDSVAYGLGAPVVLTGDSNTADIATLSGQLSGFENYKEGQLPEVVEATASASDITGIIVGVANYADQPGNPTYRRASTNAVVYVEVSPDVVYEIQSDAAAAVHDSVDIGSGINLKTNGVCNTATGNHEFELDSSSLGTGATTQFTIVGLSRNPDRDEIASANPGFLVKINNRNLAPNSAGI